METSTWMADTDTAITENWKDRALRAERKLRAIELVMICANDIVAAWPRMTIRTISSMANRMDTLRQALEHANKQV
jgi:hypothetical protein